MARFRTVSRWIARWIVLVSLWLADALIWLMLRTRRDERRVRATERITWPKGLKHRLMKRQNNICVYCGHRRTALRMEIDHIIPAVRGGSNEESNLQVICSPCNQRKSLQTDEEFRARYRRLVPQRAMTPPNRRISQHEFREETRRTSQADVVRAFRKTRFISKRNKVVSGCLILGGIIALVVFVALAQLGAGGGIVLLLSVIFGGAAAFGIWLRAHITGAMIEDEG